MGRFSNIFSCAVNIGLVGLQGFQQGTRSAIAGLRAVGQAAGNMKANIRTALSNAFPNPFTPLSGIANQLKNLGTTSYDSAQEVANLKGRLDGMLASVKNMVMDLTGVGEQFAAQRRMFLLSFKDPELAQQKFMAALSDAEKTQIDTISALKFVSMGAKKGADMLKMYEVDALKNGVLMKTQVSAMQLMDDLIQGTGQATQNVQYNFNLAMAGNARNFRALFDGMEKVTKVGDVTAAEAFKKAKTVQERTDVIMETTRKLYGGLGASAAGTFGFMKAALSDVILNIKGLIGEKLLPLFEKPLARLVDMLSKLKENKPFIEGMTKSIGLLVKMAMVMANVAMDVLQVFINLIANHPKLVGFIGIIGTLTIATLSAVASVSLFVAGFKTFLVVIYPQVKAAFLTLGILLKTMLSPWLLATIGTVVLFGYIWKQNFGGIQQTAAKVGLFFKGLWAVFSTYKDGTSRLTESMAASLEKSGLLKHVVRLGMWAGSIKQLFIELADRIKIVAFAASLAFRVHLEQPLTRIVNALRDGIVGSLGGLVRKFFGQDLVLGTRKVSFLALAIGAISYGAEKAGLMMTWLVDTVDAWWPTAKAILSWVYRIPLLILKLIPPMLESLNKAWPNLKESLAELWVQFKYMIANIGDSMTRIGKVISGIMGPILKSLGYDLEDVTGNSATFGEIAVFAFDMVFKVIEITIYAVAELMKGIGLLFDDLLNGPKLVWNGFMLMIHAIGYGAELAIWKVKDVVMSIVVWITNKIAGMIDLAADAALAVGDKLGIGYAKGWELADQARRMRLSAQNLDDGRAARPDYVQSADKFIRDAKKDGMFFEIEKGSMTQKGEELARQAAEMKGGGGGKSGEPTQAEYALQIQEKLLLKQEQQHQLMMESLKVQKDTKQAIESAGPPPSEVNDWKNWKTWMPFGGQGASQ